MMLRIALLFAWGVSMSGPVWGSESASAEGASGDINQVIADRFVDALRRRNYVFLTESELASLRAEIRDFAARYQHARMSPAARDSLLAALDPYVRQQFLNRHLDYPDFYSSAWDVEGAYLKFRDVINTFKWQLWRALTRKPLTPEQAVQRADQHDWLRKFVAGVPARPGDGYPPGVSVATAHSWASERMEEMFADPLSLLYDPMPAPQFEIFQTLMERSAINGLATTVGDIPVRAIGALAHTVATVDTAYDYPFDIELPFVDEVRSVWGGGAGAGPHLAFASNAQFRGEEAFLDRYSHPIFDIVSGLVPPLAQKNDAQPAASADQWAQEHNVGDIRYDDPNASLKTLRGARMAELNVANWFEADRVSNADLRRLIREQSKTAVSVARLPPMNGPRRVGESDPRFFVVVENAAGRLAVLDLREREFFSMHFVSRLRPVD